MRYFSMQYKQKLIKSAGIFYSLRFIAVH